MEVILLQDVRKVGKKGQIVKVADGYGQNFLIKNQLAVLATAQGRAALKRDEEQQAEIEKQKKAEAEALAEKMKDLVLEFKLSGGTNGRVFGGISIKQITEALREQHGIRVDKRKFIDFYPIHALGYTEVKVELYKGVVAQFRVHTIEK